MSPQIHLLTKAEATGVAPRGCWGSCWHWGRARVSLAEGLCLRLPYPLRLHPPGRRDMSRGATTPLCPAGPRSPEGPAWPCSFPLGRVGCSHPSLPAGPTGWRHRERGKCRLGHFCEGIKQTPCCCLVWCYPLHRALHVSVERSRRRSAPVPACCSTRGHTRTHVSLCVNLCRWQLMFLPCPLQQMADFSVGYLYLRLIFPSVFYFCL